MDLLYILLISGSIFLALFWAIVNMILVLRVDVKFTPGESQKKVNLEEDEENTFVEINKMAMVKSIGLKIETGAKAFLIQEYCAMFIFIIIFGGVVLVAVDFFGKPGGFQQRFYAFAAFGIGSITSMLCGWIGMIVAVKSNYRATYMAT